MNANTYSSMPFIPYKIIMALMGNDDFCKLVYYNTIDALSQSNLTTEQKRNLIWDGDISHTEDYHIFMTNTQPNEELENRTVVKIYKYDTSPDNILRGTICYRIDVLFGTKIPIVTCENLPCNRGDLIETEIMKTLNGKDVAGVGCLQFNADLSALCTSHTGVGNNYSFTGLTIIMATQNMDVRETVCLSQT